MIFILFIWDRKMRKSGDWKSYRNMHRIYRYQKHSKAHSKIMLKLSFSNLIKKVLKKLMIFLIHFFSGFVFECHLWVPLNS